jgi:hypothetical protein
MSSYEIGRLRPGDLGYHDTQYHVDQAAEVARDAAVVAMDRFDPFPVATPLGLDPVLRARLRARLAALFADARASEDENELRLCFQFAERALVLVEETPR